MNSMDEMGMDFPQSVTVLLCDRTVNTEVSGDFTLPDYQPELRRLLAVMPTPLPPAKYVGSTGVELNGTVDYQVLYVGGDGGIYSVLQVALGWQYWDAERSCRIFLVRSGVWPYFTGGHPCILY